MSKFIDLVGKKFGRLLVLSKIENPIGKRTRWLCICDCGNKKEVMSKHLLSGLIQSCKCFQKEQTAKSNKENAPHGHSTGNNGKRTPTYISWQDAKRRCIYPKDIKYPLYGGRGILMCRRWLNSFINFLKDMGERPLGTTIERINTNGNYEPENCKWGTSREQNKNRRKKNG